MKIKSKIAALALAAVCTLTSCGTAPAGEVLDFHDQDSIETRFVKALQATTVYMVEPYNSLAENLLIASLQGLAAKNSAEQILIKWGNIDFYLPYLTETWGAAIETTIDGQELNLETLATHYKNTVNGYILCSGEPESESVNVAISLAGVLNSLIATPQTEEMLKNSGYTCVLDVSDKNDSWLRKSEYWKMLNRDIAIEQPNSSAPRLVDYAILSNAYFNFANTRSQEKHTNMFEFLNDNAIILGWNNTLGEYETVESFSSLNVQMIPSDHATNLSTLSGFALEKLTQKTENTASPDAENVHTVCIVMSDGDNLQWTLNNYAKNPYFFESEHRGKFKMAWGLPPSAIDLIAPVTQYFYDNMTENDEFIMQLSGLGYTFPSHWDDVVRKEMTSQLATVMDRYDIRFAEILDDEGFYAENLADFTAQDAIDAIFYIDYADYYAGLGGEIIWTNGKPAVSAKYSIWANKSDNSGELDYIAEHINSASTDVKSEDSYSFIIVHAWSGLSDGKLVPDGNTMDAVAALVEKFDEHVEVVTPSEFMDRLIKNCK